MVESDEEVEEAFVGGVEGGVDLGDGVFGEAEGGEGVVDDGGCFGRGGFDELDCFSDGCFV